MFNNFVSCKQNSVHIICTQQSNISFQIRSEAMVTALKQVVYGIIKRNIEKPKKLFIK